MMMRYGKQAYLVTALIYGNLNMMMLLLPWVPRWSCDPCIGGRTPPKFLQGFYRGRAGKSNHDLRAPKSCFQGTSKAEGTSNDHKPRVQDHTWRGSITRAKW